MACDVNHYWCSAGPLEAKPKSIILAQSWLRGEMLRFGSSISAMSLTECNGAELLTESACLLDLLHASGSQVGGAPEVYVGQLLGGFFRVDQNERADRHRIAGRGLVVNPVNPVGQESCKVIRYGDYELLSHPMKTEWTTEIHNSDTGSIFLFCSSFTQKQRDLYFLEMI